MPAPPKGAALIALVAAMMVAVGCIAAPLAVYSVTLAAFGLPHVLSELRYVDLRFGRSLGRRTLTAMALLLAAIIACRTAGVVGGLRPEVEQPLELGLVALLALTAARGQPSAIILAIGVALVVGVLAIVDPFEAMVGFAVLHNLTPLGFLWQLAPPRRRPQVMALASALFLGLPLLVATGAPRLALAPFMGAAEVDPIGAGPLAADLPAYVPHSLLAGGNAVDLFTASVVAQQAHYAAVIVVLPWLLSRWSPGAKSLFPWPRAPLFYALVAGLGALAFTRFAADFMGARAIYGIAASLHAWIEVPILVIALGSVQRASTSPTAKEAPLVTSDSGIA